MVADLLDLLKKRPEIADAHYPVGFCYEKMNDITKAREHFRKYVAAAKDEDFVRRAYRRLREPFLK